MTNIISPDQIPPHLSRAAQGIAIEVVAETGSTNTDLLERIRILTVPILRIALKQTAGRGRNGRAWYSEEGASLTFSLAWRFLRPPQFLSGLSLAVGVSLAKTLHDIGVKVQLKWPNDILKEGKKLAGILIELSTKNNQINTDSCWTVIGVGLNLSLPDSLNKNITQAAADAPRLAKMDKNLLIAKLLNQLVEALNLFEKKGLMPFISEWNKLHLYAGQEVVIFNKNRPDITGTATGIDENGRLLLESNSHKIAVHDGDISLRSTKEKIEHVVTH